MNETANDALNAINLAAQRNHISMITLYRRHEFSGRRLVVTRDWTVYADNLTGRTVYKLSVTDGKPAFCYLEITELGDFDRGKRQYRHYRSIWSGRVDSKSGKALERRLTALWEVMAGEEAKKEGTVYNPAWKDPHGPARQTGAEARV